jgi:hypothetical protein
MKYPMKSYLLKCFSDREEMWEFETFPMMEREYGVDISKWRYDIRFWLIEYEVGGMLELTGTAMDSTHYGKTKLVHRYRLTEMGHDRIDTMLR